MKVDIGLPSGAWSDVGTAATEAEEIGFDSISTA